MDHVIDILYLFIFALISYKCLNLSDRRKVLVYGLNKLVIFSGYLSGFHSYFPGSFYFVRVALSAISESAPCCFTAHRFILAYIQQGKYLWPLHTYRLALEYPQKAWRNQPSGNVHPIYV